MHNIEMRLQAVRTRITKAADRCGRSPESVRLLAVSKTRPAEDLEIAYRAGQTCFGENYLQEALTKQQALEDLDIEWHFIGPIQSKKTRAIAENFSWVHSVDRLKIAERLNEQRPMHLPPLNICVQVNLDDEESKSGTSLAALPELLYQISELPALHLRGLMAIPAPRDSFDQQYLALQPLQNALLEIRQKIPTLDTLSMGMSGDLEAAVAAGATIVRIGTDIFGARNSHP